MIAALIALISSPLLSNAGMTPDACERIQLQLQQSKPEETEAARSALDWPDLCKYAAQNGEVTVRPRVVFIGDSITEFWLRSQPEYFVAGYLDRGISGQTSSQILLRFYQDAIALRPSVVHVMVGTNDVAGNTGPESPETWKNNIRAMVAIARYSRVRLVFGSLLPADAFWWRPSVRPARQIAQLNEWLRSFCRSNGIPFINYYDGMATSTGGLKREFSDDGVHPNKRGYEVMRSTASPVLDKMVR